MTYGHLRADCLYPGISSGPNARYRVWEVFTFTFTFFTYLLTYFSFNYVRAQAGIWGFIPTKFPKMDLRADAEYAANLETLHFG